VVAVTYYGAKREVRALFDTQLEQSARVAARTLLGVPLTDQPGDPVAPNNSSKKQKVRDQYQKNLVVQVWNEDGELVLHSKNAPMVPLASTPVGFSDAFFNGEAWRTYSFVDGSHGLTIRAGEPYRPRNYLTQHVIVQTLYPIVLGLPVITLLIWVAVGRGLTPLRRLTSQVHERDPENLIRIHAPYAPDEVRPLVEELNILLERLEQKIDKERRFIGDAAHELRTPLAGLRAHAEVALGARNARERTRALSNIVKGVDRASHLVNQLLTLSRLDESAMGTDQIVDLGDALRAVLNDLRPSADEKSIAMALRAEPENKFPILGNVEAICVLFRNLVDNAIRYAPPSSEVSLALTQQKKNWVITIADEGSGIPADDRDKVFDRFHRRTKTDAYGTGLGLSIVKSVVDLHQGNISMQQRDNHSGLCVQVSLPVCRPESLTKDTSHPAVPYGDEHTVPATLVAEH
jgi:two-component system sensor histidine kinase QseC